MATYYYGVYVIPERCDGWAYQMKLPRIAMRFKCPLINSTAGEYQLKWGLIDLGSISSPMEATDGGVSNENATHYY